MNPLNTILIGLLNVLIGALCISICESGLIGILYAPFVMIFGLVFIPISIFIVIAMFLIREYLLKHSIVFVLFGAMVGIIISIQFFAPAFKENTD